MLRKLHTYPALIAALFVSLMAMSGAILSLEPVLAQWHATSASHTSGNVADLAEKVGANFAEPQNLIRKPSGDFLVYHYGIDGLAIDYVDPQTGKSLGTYNPSAFFSIVTEFHRSFLVRDLGRLIAGISAFAMTILSVSGLLLLAKRMGGWTKFFGKARGTSQQKLHVQIGRISSGLLIVSALSGVWMSMVNFDLLSDGEIGFLPYPTNASGGIPAPISQLQALQAIDQSNLRELVFPILGDALDVFGITTSAGSGFVDQATGDMLAFTHNSLWQNAYQTAYTLHTGQGFWWYALILGAGAICVKVMVYSGLLVWWRRTKVNTPKLTKNTSSAGADTVILVGSQSRTTWGFAASLHNAFVANGNRVHTAPMNQLAREYPEATNLFILTATAGDGAAPQSGDKFMSKLKMLRVNSNMRYAVLGFGDRSFQRFCQFAHDVDDAMDKHGHGRLRKIFEVDRQSTGSVSAWVDEIGALLNQTLAFNYVPSHPNPNNYVLLERTEYGAEHQEPKVILRFCVRSIWKGGKKFEAGDLIGISPSAGEAPRYYSLASSRKDGFLEICVNKVSGGACSGYLHNLRLGDQIEGFIRTNPEFRPQSNQRPVIMIGAGTGIAPFAGFLRGNIRKRSMSLYWGGRDPVYDFLYREHLEDWRMDGRLTDLSLAFSRIKNGQYVQDKLRQDAAALTKAISDGGQILVCGGTDMARDVRRAIDEICLPLGTSCELLKQDGKFIEDVY